MERDPLPKTQTTQDPRAAGLGERSDEHIDQALRLLPVHAPAPSVDQATHRAALAALDAAPGPRLGERLLFGIAVPSALALTTLLYLQWAVRAASSLY